MSTMNKMLKWIGLADEVEEEEEFLTATHNEPEEPVKGLMTMAPLMAEEYEIRKTF